MSEHSQMTYSVQRTGDDALILEGERIVAILKPSPTGERPMEEAERIVACVNFLAGIPFPLLADILRDAEQQPSLSPLDDIRQHILRWYELNPHLWANQECVMKMNLNGKCLAATSAFTVSGLGEDVIQRNVRRHLDLLRSSAAPFVDHSLRHEFLEYYSLDARYPHWMLVGVTLLHFDASGNLLQSSTPDGPLREDWHP